MLSSLRNLLSQRPGHSAATHQQDPVRDGTMEPCPQSASVQEAGSPDTSVGDCSLAASPGSSCLALTPDQIGIGIGLDILLRQPADFTAEEATFTHTYGAEYGYGGELDRIRAEEFRRLDGQAYLDYAGAALYSERQIRDGAEELVGQLLCNPHSRPTSPSAEALTALRRDTLALLNADGREYEVVLTSGATAALKLVAECFPWSPGASCLAHPSAVHNSVLGMRGPALAAGAAVQLVQLETALDKGLDAAAGPTAAAAGTTPTAAAAAAETAKEANGRPSGTASCLVPSRVVASGPPLNTAMSSGRPGVGRGGGGEDCPCGHAGDKGGPYHLLALPVECNFTGDREPLGAVVRHVQRHGVCRTAAAAATVTVTGTAVSAEQQEAVAEQEEEVQGPSRDVAGHGRWLVLLDAAKACSTAPPDLSAVPADFVVLSYYKIFGHPTGLGALVARKDAVALLAAGKAYFGGGTVEVAVADRDYQVRRPGPPGLENGTPPFTAIAAARHGFAFLRRLGGLPAVHRHSVALARWLASRLAALRHANGAPVCALYGKWCSAAAAGAAAEAAAATATGSTPHGVSIPDHGPTIAFNLLRPDGSWVGYAEVGRLAAMHGLHLRTGCFCNPGACAAWLGLTAEDVIRHHSSGHVCWDDHDLVAGRPTGAVRVSLGAVSTFREAFCVLQLVRRYFVDAGGGNGGGGGGEGRGSNSSSGGIGRTVGFVAAPAAASVAASALKGTAAAVAAANGCRRDGGTRATEEELSCDAEPTAGEDTGDKVPPAVTAAGCVTQPSAAAPSASRSFSLPPPRPPGESPSALTPLTPSPVVPAAGAGRARAGCGSAQGQGSCSGGGVTASSVFGGGGGGGGSGRLSAILLYPVKSCAAQAVAAWPVGPTGLLYDREWALVDDSGRVVTLKQCPRMALIRPVVDLTRGSLTIHAPAAAGVSPLQLAIPGASCHNNHLRDHHHHHHHHNQQRQWQQSRPVGHSAEEVLPLASVVGTEASGYGDVRLDAGLTMERVQVCGDTVCSDLVDACHHDGTSEGRIREWFTRVLGVPCRIVRQRTGARKVRRPAGQGALRSASMGGQPGSDNRNSATAGSGRGDDPDVGSGIQEGAEDGAVGDSCTDTAEPAVGFANDGQYLLVSEASMADLHARMVTSRLCSSHNDNKPPASQSAAPTELLRQTGDDNLLARFRPNLVVSGFAPYEEDGWKAVHVGPLRADVLGTCPRCELLQVDPRVGMRRGSEVLIALAQYRRRGGRVQFGVLLAAAVAEASAALPTSVQVSQASAGTAERDWDASQGLAPSPSSDALSPAEGSTAAEVKVAGGSVHGDGGTASVDWLRQRFGQLAVVAVGDKVVPYAAAP